MDIPATLYAQTFTTRQRETLNRLADFIEDWILITPDAGAIASAIAGHAALTSGVHGISAFGATLIDDASAAVARTTLGLGTIAVESKTSMPSLTFAEGQMVTFGTPALPDEPEDSPALPDSTVVALNLKTNNNHLLGYTPSSGVWISGQRVSWYHKTGGAGTQVMYAVLSGTPGSSTFTFSGKYYTYVAGANYASSYELGLKQVPVNDQSFDYTGETSYTLNLYDSGMGVGKSDTNALTIVVPPNASVAFPVGTVIAYFNDGSTGDLTISQGSGVTIVLDGTTTTGNRTVSAGGTGRLWKVGTDRWICGGSATV